MHIAFTNSCPENLLESLSKQTKLATRIMSFVEANIDFKIFTDNVFLVNPIPDTQQSQ